MLKSDAPEHVECAQRAGDVCEFSDHISPHWESDPGPLLYQRSALPLSYVGKIKGGEKRIRTSEAFRS